MIIALHPQSSPRAPGAPFPTSALGFCILASALALGACQDGSTDRPTVSLDQAKQITADFSGPAYEPPPRTIADITRLLDEHPLSDPEEVRERRAKAGRQPPEGADESELAGFYHRRARAARQLGLDAQALADWRRAAELADSGAARGRNLRREIFHGLAWTEIGSGNYLDGIRNMRKAVNADDLAKGTRGGLVRAYAHIGDLEKARAAQVELKRVLGGAQGGGGAWGIYHRLAAQSAILSAEGRHAEAEPLIRGSIEAFQNTGEANRYPEGVLARQRLLARNLGRQGRLVEAEIEGRAALNFALSVTGRDSALTGNAVRQLAYILVEQGRLAEAESLSRKAIEIFRGIGTDESSTWMSASRSALAISLMAQGRTAGALEQFERLRDGLEGSNQFLYEKWFRSSVWLPLALLRSGQTERARGALEDSYRETRERLGAKHYETASRGGLLAVALAQSGDKQGASERFAEAMPILLSRSRQSEQEFGQGAAKDVVLDYIVEGYLSLLAESRGAAIETQLTVDAAAEGFRLADAARGRAVQRALAASATRAAAKDPELADLVRREQDARTQIGTLYQLLANAVSAPSAQQDRSVEHNLRVRIDDLRGARGALMGEIEQRFPDYAQLINPKPATVDQSRSLLAPDEALIATYVGADRSFVWALSRSGPTQFAEIPLGRERMAAIVTDLRRALDPKAATLGDIPPFDVVLAHRLYQALLEPVKDGWKDAGNLLVVADGPLGQLPFSLLPTARVSVAEDRDLLFERYRQVPWLARDHAVTFLPSVASLATLRGLPVPSSQRRAFAGFGDPWFSAAQAAAAATETPTQVAELASRGILATRGIPLKLRSLPQMAQFDTADLAKLPRLPDTADEIRALAVAMNADLDRDIFLGKAANEQTVKQLDLANYEVLAFATHGLVPGDLNGLSQPALALTAPEVAGVPGDGLLTLTDILGLRLDADWVVLSACNTAAADGAGAEAVSGLGRAFFYAGTRALLVSNWPVETTSARALTSDLFARQAGSAGPSRAEALRQARLALIDGPGLVAGTGESVFSYAHPIFWAPFTLIGDGGQGSPGA